MQLFTQWQFSGPCWKDCDCSSRRVVADFVPNARHKNGINEP
jgi:hypothetical protein